jgi:hypothetical protein
MQRNDMTAIGQWIFLSSMPLCKALNNVLFYIFVGFWAEYAEIILTRSENTRKESMRYIEKMQRDSWCILLVR